MDVGEHAELGEFDFNWTRFATIENKFNVVTTSMVGLQFFQNMIRLMAVTWSMVHAAVCFLAGCTVMQLAVLASTVTAMVCLVWYLRAGMSHLSYGKRLQCRLDRTKTRRLRMNTQRQLLAVIFLCGMSSAHAMEGQALCSFDLIPKRTLCTSCSSRSPHERWIQIVVYPQQGIHAKHTTEEFGSGTGVGILSMLQQGSISFGVNFEL